MELRVWQLADQLRGETVKLTKRPQYLRHLRLREQTDDAIDSVCRNIAEGFASDTHAQFAWYLRISRRSLNELKDALHSAQGKDLVTADGLIPARKLMTRLFPPLNRFIAYLERTPKQRNRPHADPRKDGKPFYYRIE